MPEFLPPVEIVEREHISDIRLARADDGLADEDRRMLSFWKIAISPLLNMPAFFSRAVIDWDS